MAEAGGKGRIGRSRDTIQRLDLGSRPIRCKPLPSGIQLAINLCKRHMRLISSRDLPPQSLAH